MIGTTIAHYKILTKLGQGGMGHVYLAEDLQLGRRVAIKLLAPEFALDPSIKERFKQEAKAVAALSHANIVTIYEFGDFNNNPYIVMEYIDGKSLREKLAKTKLPWPEVITIIRQICEGLNKSHRTGIIHRDLKPENILFDSDGGVKILDFGLAKFRNHQNITQKSMRLGTINYMSPEQLRGKEIDVQSDIFSLGVILYEILCGQLPFSAEYEASLIYSILHDQPRPIKEYDPNLPPALQKVIERALAKDKTARYRTVNELSLDLAAIQDHPGIAKPESEIGDPGSVEQLLEHRQQIDKLIESKYKKSIVILISDIVGSTEFFEQRGDIEGRAMVSRHHRQMFPLIQNYQGEIIKTMGDSIMASFQDVAAATRCACEMQIKLAAENKKLPPDDRIKIRIALHYGMAVIEEGDVYGDAVNVAARIEKLTGGGQIMISQSVVDALGHDTDQTVVQAGNASVKGKAEKIALYRLRWYDEEIIKPVSDHDSQLKDLPTPPAPAGSFGVNIIAPYRMKIPPQTSGETLDRQLQNPYMNRVMIQDSAEFYGRRNEIEKIYSRIGSSRPQSISLVGERRIGKSSLLNFIYQPLNRRKYLNNPDEYIFIFIDFQERRGIGIKEFFTIIFQALLDAFDGNLELNLEPDYEGFKKVIATFDERKLKLIMLFDEFELVTKNENFDTEFYSFCRSIANNYNVAYLVSSGRNLQTLCHSKQISDSPFFNIFSNITLGQFTVDEAKNLICKPAEKLNYSLSAYVDFVLDVAGFYPFFIQMACAALYEQIKKGEQHSRSFLEKVKDDFLDEAKVHFQQIWATADEEQREVFLNLSQGKKVRPEQEYLLKILEKEGYLKPGKKRPEIFSSLFKSYIVNRFGTEHKSSSRIWSFIKSS